MENGTVPYVVRTAQYSNLQYRVNKYISSDEKMMTDYVGKSRKMVWNSGLLGIMMETEKNMRYEQK